MQIEFRDGRIYAVDQGQPNNCQSEPQIRVGEDFIIRNFWMENLKMIAGEANPYILKALVVDVQDTFLEGKPHQGFTLRGVDHMTLEYKGSTHRRRGRGLYESRHSVYLYGRPKYMSDELLKGFCRPTIIGYPSLTEVVAPTNSKVG